MSKKKTPTKVKPEQVISKDQLDFNSEIIKALNSIRNRIHNLELKVNKVSNRMGL